MRRKLELARSESDPTSDDDIFRDYNCWKCSNGERRCIRIDPRQCEYLHARDD